MSSHARAILRRFLPFVISALALAAVIAFADLTAFRGLMSRVRWDRLPVIAVAVFGTVLVVAWRWRTLLLEALPMRRSLVVTAISLGANHILPLRGGDALRIVLSAQGPGAPSIHAGVSAMAMEKVLDLIAVAAFGLASAAVVAAPGSADAQTNSVAVALVILVLAVAALLAARSGLLIRSLRLSARALRLRPRLYRHLLRPLHHLQQSTSPRRIGLLLIQTAIVWQVLYVLAFVAAAQWVGVSLGIGEAMVLLFAAALGMAIPAAPSGIGTFHAAVVSAFVLLGRPASEGLVLAVAAHGVFFVGFCTSAALAMATLHRWTLSQLESR